MVSKVERFLTTRFSMDTSAVMMSSSMWGMSKCGTSKGSKTGMPSAGFPSAIICLRSSKICLRKSSTGSLRAFCWDRATRERERMKKVVNFMIAKLGLSSLFVS